jgi:hypothetical protein
MVDIQKSIDNLEKKIRKAKLEKNKMVDLIANLDQMRQYISGNINKL